MIQAWLLNATVYDNIAFGLAHDEAKYRQTIRSCALIKDLALFRNGDCTVIGEHGICLSGGQKHRVALARAVYAEADAYVMDEPLSAVDSHVAKWLFDKCIGKHWFPVMSHLQ